MGGLLWSLIIPILSGVVAPPGTDITPDEIMRRYALTLEQAQSWSLEVTATTRVERPLADPEWRVRSAQSRTTYHRQGARRDADSIQVAVFDADGARVADRNVGRRSRAIINGWFVSYEMGRNGTASGGAYAEDGTKFTAYVLGRCGRGQAMEGYAGDRESIFEIYGQASDRPAAGGTELVDGLPCVVLEWSSAYGKHKLWLDPTVGYQPRKIVVTKGGDDIHGSDRISKSFGMIPYGSKKPVSLRSVEYTADAFRYDAIRGLHFPTGCRVTEVLTYSDDNLQRSVTECVRSKIDLAPDRPLAGAFVPQLPDGLPLSNQQSPQIPFEWRGGRPVPRVDKEAVSKIDAAVDRLRSPPTESSSRSR